MSRKVYNYHETRDELFNNVMEKSLAAANSSIAIQIQSVGVYLFLVYYVLFCAFLSCVVLFPFFGNDERDFSLSLSLKEEEVSSDFCFAERKKKKNPKPSLNLGFQKRGRGGLFVVFLSLYTLECIIIIFTLL